MFFNVLCYIVLLLLTKAFFDIHQNRLKLKASLRNSMVFQVSLLAVFLGRMFLNLRCYIVLLLLTMGVLVSMVTGLKKF